MINYLIIYSCIGISSMYQTACRKSVEAALLQTGFKEQYTLVEHNATTKITRMANQYISSDVGTISAAIYTIIVQKEVKYSLPFQPVSDTISLTANPGFLGLAFLWRFH